MSIETTYNIKRSDALRMLTERTVGGFTDPELSDILYVLRSDDERFENYWVIPDSVDCTDGEFTKTGW